MLSIKTLNMSITAFLQEQKWPSFCNNRAYSLIYLIIKPLDAQGLKRWPVGVFQ